MTSADPSTAETSRPRARRRERILATVAATVAATGIVAGGCGGDDGVAPQRTYDVQLHIDDSAAEYEYVPDQAFDIKVGDRVTFRIANTGLLPHDVQIVDPDGKEIARGPVAEPGEVIEAVVTFEQAGIYQLNCLVGDHLTVHRMQALVNADDAAP